MPASYSFLDVDQFLGCVALFDFHLTVPYSSMSNPFARKATVTRNGTRTGAFSFRSIEDAEELFDCDSDRVKKFVDPGGSVLVGWCGKGTGLDG